MVAEASWLSRRLSLLRQAIPLLRAAHLLAFAAEKLHRLPLPLAEKELAAELPQSFPDLSPEELAQRLRRAGRLCPRAGTCLPRALCLKVLLERRDLRAMLRLGVRRSAGSLEAHAWVELEGRPVGESPDFLARFEPLEKPTPAQLSLLA